MKIRCKLIRMMKWLFSRDFFEQWLGKRCLVKNKKRNIFDSDNIPYSIEAGWVFQSFH